MTWTPGKSQFKCLGSLCSRGHHIISRLTYNDNSRRRHAFGKIYRESLGTIGSGLLTSKKKQTEISISPFLQFQTGLIHCENLSFGIAGSPTLNPDQIT